MFEFLKKRDYLEWKDYKLQIEKRDWLNFLTATTKESILNLLERENDR